MFIKSVKFIILICLIVLVGDMVFDCDFVVVFMV